MKKLANGIRTIIKSEPARYSVVIGAFIEAGLPEEKVPGTAHFLEHMLFKGTKKRTALELVSQIEEVGGSINAFTSKEYTVFYIQILKKDFELAADILADMLIDPVWSDPDLIKEKQVVREEIKMYEEIPEELGSDLLLSSVWPDNYLGKNILGTPRDLEKLDSQVLREYFDAFYVGSRTHLVVLGNIEEDQAFKILKIKFAKMARGKKESTKRKSCSSLRSGRFFQKIKTEQCHLNIGTVAYGTGDKRKYAVMVADLLLGASSFSRLYQKVREKYGYAYSIYSYHQEYKTTGLWAIYAAVSPEYCEEVVKIIFAEINQMLKTGLSSAIVQQAKNTLTGNLLIGLEDPVDRLLEIGRQSIYNEPLRTAEEMIALIQNVTSEDVLTCFEEFWQSGNTGILILGPEDEDFK